MTKLERKSYDAVYYRKNRVRITSRKRHYKKHNPEKVHRSQKLYRDTHQVKIRRYIKKYRRINKSKIAATVKAYHKSHRKEIQLRQRQRVYGVTQEQLASLMSRQNNKCAICKTKFKTPKNTHLDHNHTTNQVRAFLCTACNVGLGYFRENIPLLRAAINYIKKWNTA